MAERSAAESAGPPSVRLASGWLNVIVICPFGSACTMEPLGGLVASIARLDWIVIVVDLDRPLAVPPAVSAADAAIRCGPSPRGVPLSVIVAMAPTA